MKINKNKKLSNKDQFKIRGNGFTLMEVLVAIFIVIVGLSATLTLITRIFAAGEASASKLVAANLAQEGIEVIKNIRDTYFYDPDSEDVWDSFFAADIDGGVYSVQYDSADLSGASYDQFLKYDPSSKLYQYDTGSDTPFKRAIRLYKLTSEGGKTVEVKVESIINWSERGHDYSLIVEDRLWNWR